MISLNNDPCCVCGQTKSLLMQETTYPEHGYPGSFCLRRCSECGLLFNSPRLDDAELAKLYGRNYYFFSRADSTELARAVPMYSRSVALVTAHVRPMRCLDIGSGRGFLPALLTELGWDAHGIEISRDAANYARSRFGLKNIFTGTAEQYVASPQAAAFPLVTAIDVIEHVPSPDAFAASLAKAVEPNGLLIVDTPNGSAYNARVEGTRWKGYNPFHIYLFSIPNLRRLLEKHGFTVEQSFSYGNAPADRDPAPVARRLRHAAIDAARATGTLSLAARTYFKLTALAAPRGDTKQLLARAAETARSAPPYTTTADSEDTLARDATGDNIVLVARKR